MTYSPHAQRKKEGVFKGGKREKEFYFQRVAYFGYFLCVCSLLLILSLQIVHWSALRINKSETTKCWSVRILWGIFSLSFSRIKMNQIIIFLLLLRLSFGREGVFILFWCRNNCGVFLLGMNKFALWIRWDYFLFVLLIK